MIYFLPGFALVLVIAAFLFRKWVMSLIAGFLFTGFGVIELATQVANSLGWVLAWGGLMLAAFAIFETYAINKKFMDEEEQRLNEVVRQRRVKYAEDNNWGKRVDQETYNLLRIQNEANASKVINGGLAKRPIGMGKARKAS